MAVFRERARRRDVGLASTEIWLQGPRSRHAYCLYRLSKRLDVIGMYAVYCGSPFISKRPPLLGFLGSPLPPFLEYVFESSLQLI